MWGGVVRFKNRGAGKSDIWLAYACAEALSTAYAHSPLCKLALAPFMKNEKRAKGNETKTDKVVPCQRLFQVKHRKHREHAEVMTS